MYADRPSMRGFPARTGTYSAACQAPASHNAAVVQIRQNGPASGMPVSCFGGSTMDLPYYQLRDGHRDGTMVDVLIPTCRRKTGLAVVLTSLLGQTFTDFNVIVSDQTDDGNYLDSIEIRTLVLALRRRGHHVELYRRLPRRG